MDRAKKRLASALDGFRSQHKSEMELEEKITAEDVCLTGIVRHGFPDDPRCMAYDVVQRLLAIGTGHGIIRVIGDVGVDYCLKHESDAAVLHIQFLTNEGALVTACRDDLIHLWNFRQKVPVILHSIQLTKEQITCISHSFQSKWLYLGTERGNVYFVKIATFTLSSYAINWNKAIDLGVRTHPGGVKAISTCPTELSKLLILYEKGSIVLWNLQTKEVERFISDHPARCFAWHHDGRQFMCGTADGCLLVWNIRKPGEYIQKLQPHGQKCNSINQVDWRHSADGEQLIIFGGGMSQEDGVFSSLTIMRASKSITVLELDHPLITFTPLNSSPYSSVSQQPSSVAVLMKNDLLVIDLTIPGYPCHENVTPMDIHESRVRCICYFSNCPLDLLGALALVGSKQRRQGFSDKPWPITGGSGRDCAMGHQELLLTGHEDGSIKFWQASGEHLQILYKLKSGRHFERNDGLESHEASHAVTMIELCLDSRLLLVAAQSGQLTLFRFVKTENAHEITVINIPSTFSFLSGNVESNKTSPKRELRRQGTAISVESNSTDTSEGSTNDGYFPLKVKGGVLRRLAGYQPDLVCMVPWRNASQPETITAVALNSAYGIIALGTSSSLTLIDLVQYIIICSWSLADLYMQQHSTPILLSQNSNSSQYDPFVISSQQQETSTTNVSLEMDTIYSGDISAKCATPKGAKTTSPIQLRPSNKLSHRRKLFKHMTLGKTFLSRTADGNEKMKTMETITTENKETFTCKHTSPHNLDHKKRFQLESTSVRSNEILRAEDSEGVREVDVNCLIDKLRVRRKTFIRSSTIHTSTASDEQFKSMSGSKITLDSTITKRTSVDESPSSTNKMFFSESVTSLTFIQSFVKKRDPRAHLCLWVGTSASTCIIYHLLLPTDRQNSTVSVAHSGSIVQTRGRMLYTTLMDRNFCLLEGAAESYHEKVIAKPKEDDRNHSEENNFPNKVLTKLSLSPTCSNATEYSREDDFLQFAVLVSEDEVHTVALPNFNSLFLYRPEFPFVKARATHVHGYPVLMLLNGAGQIVILSLPSLRLLLCSNLFRHSVDYDDPICFKTSFAEHGLGMYTITPSEIQKFTICSELASQVQESAGELFVPVDMPEPPKSSFLKGMSTLFASQKDSFDLDSIFLDKNSNSVPGSSMRSIAKTIPGPSSMEQATARGASAGQAANMALQALHERAEKLNVTVDATERLKENAMTLSQRTGKLVEKYEKKKWYNF
ncbi:Tomosyn (vertebrate synaptic protein) homolog protein 1-like [Brugia malayi]|uniref:Tomosyn (Vertebrate synaptic protein) homolog protein 1-like n=1 Tax=Brugia malayi TaxID=6279 RepID=A0A4E9FFV9_BRUMA|nr:Tomosyn (vertebrate synaptic protein) homolog protein 1-like [Brugia malayi]VIO95811.1 Tomosyn (vertebrate synaptic protein) homolog protein 1-like [Brugia malayi]